MNFDAQGAARRLHDALQGLGTNDKLLIDVLAGLHPAQQQALYSAYFTLYNRRAEKDIAKDLSGNYRRLATLLVLPRPIMQAKLVRMAVKGLGTNDVLLCDVLGTLLPSEVQPLAEAYRNKYNRDIVRDVKADTSLRYQKVLVAILQGARPENTPPDMGQVQRDVDALYNAMKGLGTKEDVVIEVMTRRSRLHLGEVQARFKERTGQKLTRWIKGDFSGELERILLTIARSSTKLTTANLLPVGGFVFAIRHAIKGLGTDDRRLVANAALAAPFHAVMPAAYKEYYGRSLERDVRGDTSGNYQRLLLAVLS